MARLYPTLFRNELPGAKILKDFRILHLIGCKLQKTLQSALASLHEAGSSSYARHNLRLPSFPLFRLVPGGIRIIDSHRLCKLCGVGTKVLFVDGPRLVDNQSHHTRRAVFGGIGDERESSSHPSVGDIVPGSARCMRSLAREDPEKIAIKRNVLTNLVGGEILPRVCDERVDRASELITSTMPIQTVVSAFVADQFLGELLGEVAWRARKILFLRVDQFAAPIHGGKFISADAPE